MEMINNMSRFWNVSLLISIIMDIALLVLYLVGTIKCNFLIVLLPTFIYALVVIVSIFIIFIVSCFYVRDDIEELNKVNIDE
jgi:hypothetical protein